MPQMQFTDGRDRRQMAQALAPPVAALPDERPAAEGSRVERLLYVLWDAAIVLGFCTAAFWTFCEVKVFWN